MPMNFRLCRLCVAQVFVSSAKPAVCLKERYQAERLERSTYDLTPTATTTRFLLHCFCCCIVSSTRNVVKNPPADRATKLF